tara:strand:+ start:646 stop:1095 length:450 start_codon:yes stop_codon:yes gene_type:complete
MKGLYCGIAITLLISSIYLSLVPADEGLFITFKNSLNLGQQKIYEKIIYERVMIYIVGMLLGISFGVMYYLKYPKGEYLFCKIVAIMILTKIIFYKIYPKQPLMLYSLDRQDQVKAWADIYTEMKTRWIKSLLVGFAGYLFIAKSMTSK